MVKVNPDPQGDHERTIWFDYFNVTEGPLRLMTASPSVVQKKSTNIGSIVGTVVSVVVLVVFVLLLLLLFYRRRRRPSRYVEPIVRPEAPVVPRELPHTF
jgi:predicted PurR-regulated permease PerM